MNYSKNEICEGGIVMSKELEALENLYHNIGNSTENYLIVETALKRIEYLERVNKDLQESKDKLIEERNNKIIEKRIIYDDYNFQSIKKFVACKGCQYYQNEKCMNKDDCFWLDLEKKLKALEIIKEDLVVMCDESKNDKSCLLLGIKVNKDKLVVIYETFDKEKIDLLKEVLL